jgi:integrase
MPTKQLHPPAYCFHKGSGQAYVKLNGKRVYIGRHDTPESRAEYDALIARWLSNGRKLDAPAPADLTVEELAAAYWDYAEGYYAGTDGQPSPRVQQIKSALAQVRKLFASTPARDFGPIRLRTVRQAMIDAEWSRTYVNQQIHRVRRMFRWATERELIPGSVLVGLLAVEGLRKGRGGRETRKVRPLPDDVLETTLKHVPELVAAMVRLQRATGMRSGELVRLRGADLDVTGETWLYTPPRHKTEHLDHPRQIAIGPKAQGILSSWLVGDALAYVFSPRRSMELVRAARSKARKTPIGRGNAPGTNRKRRPKRVLHDRYTVAAYRRAIHQGCDRAFPVPTKWIDEDAKQWRSDHRWGPHRLRHAYATEARRAGFSLELIRAALGHRGVQVTSLYAEIDAGKAREIAAKIG